MKVQALLAAAGSGDRLNAGYPKALVLLKGRPLMIHSLEVFEESPRVESTIVVGHPGCLDEFRNAVRRYCFKKPVIFVAGGETRACSVLNGLEALEHSTDIVVIHDGARPLVTSQTVECAISVCAKEGAAIVAVPAKSTIKRVDAQNMEVEATLIRDRLWEAQTPQVFRKELILKAHRHSEDRTVTDDAALVERLGHAVKVIKGEYINIKITTPEDLRIAEALLS